MDGSDAPITFDFHWSHPRVRSRTGHGSRLDRLFFRLKGRLDWRRVGSISFSRYGRIPSDQRSIHERRSTAENRMTTVHVTASRTWTSARRSTRKARRDVAVRDGSDGKAGTCPGCGREGGPTWGCNGQGRVMGGLASIPGFGWWPIKAYRPCSEYIKAGNVYQRQGQSLDEVAFGKKALNDDKSLEERLRGE